MKLLPLFLIVVCLISMADLCCASEDLCENQATVEWPSDGGDGSCGESIPCSPFLTCGSCSGFILMNQFDGEQTIAEGIHSPSSFDLDDTARDGHVYGLIKPPITPVVLQS